MERVKLETDKAIEMLPDGETVHTFRNGAGMLIGADWDKSKIIEAINEHGAELAGPQAKAMNHGIAIDIHGAYLFVETKELK